MPHNDYNWITVLEQNALIFLILEVIWWIGVVIFAKNLKIFKRHGEP